MSNVLYVADSTAKSTLIFLVFRDQPILGCETDLHSGQLSNFGATFRDFSDKDRNRQVGLFRNL